jgi:hypothetical protein
MKYATVGRYSIYDHHMTYLRAEVERCRVLRPTLIGILRAVLDRHLGTFPADLPTDTPPIRFWEWVQDTGNLPRTQGLWPYQEEYLEQFPNPHAEVRRILDADMARATPDGVELRDVLERLGRSGLKLLQTYRAQRRHEPINVDGSLKLLAKIAERYNIKPDLQAAAAVLRQQTVPQPSSKADELRELTDQIGYDPTAVAAYYGVTRQTAVAWLKKHGLYRRVWVRRPVPPPPLGEVLVKWPAKDLRLSVDLCVAGVPPNSAWIIVEKTRGSRRRVLSSGATYEGAWRSLPLEWQNAGRVIVVQAKTKTVYASRQPVSPGGRVGAKRAPVKSVIPPEVVGNRKINHPKPDTKKWEATRRDLARRLDECGTPRELAERLKTPVRRVFRWLRHYDLIDDDRITFLDPYEGTRFVISRGKIIGRQ